MVINKKLIQLIAAILILVFHLGIPITNNPLEDLIVKTSFIGVDLFFLISVCSLVGKDIEYKKFIKNRFSVIYIKFVIFIFINALITGRGENVIKQLTFIELFQKGGGSFLWFLPAILIFYILFPLFLKGNKKYKTLYVFGIYIVLVIALTLTNQNQLMIIINRMPLIMITYEICSHPSKVYELLGYSLMMIGIFLLQAFCYKAKLNWPIYNLFYVMAIPSVLGVAIATPQCKLPKIINEITNSTLEIYAGQMIMGYRIASFMLNLIRVPLLSNLITMYIIVVVAVLTQKILKKISAGISQQYKQFKTRNIDNCSQRK